MFVCINHTPSMFVCINHTPSIIMCIDQFWVEKSSYMRWSRVVATDDRDGSYPRSSVQRERMITLVHATNNAVDVRLPVTRVAALDVVAELALLEAAVGVGQLEWP